MTVLEQVEPMAKKQEAKKTKDKPKPKDSGRKPMVIQVRGNAEWKAWVEELAAFHRGSIADVTDRALAAFARQIGFDKPPPER